VRQCDSDEDLLRRLQTAIMSPQTVVDAWFLKNPPWKQVNRDKNNRGEFMPNWQDAETSCRKLLELRMSLVPYLYSSFMKYRETGLPPVRALVLDWPADPKTRNIDDEYMLGEQLLVAPKFTGELSRKVYLPAGDWFSFWTGQNFYGGQTYQTTCPLEHIPIFVKSGSILPLAKPVEWIAKDTCFQMTAFTFGDTCRDFALYEDDGVTNAFERGKQAKLILSWHSGTGGKATRTGQFEPKRYDITGWKSCSTGDSVGVNINSDLATSP
jgi:alpha-D-xyloside xylohydrolase